MYSPSYFCYVCFYQSDKHLETEDTLLLPILRRIVDRMYSSILLYSATLASSTKTLVKLISSNKGLGEMSSVLHCIMATLILKIE